jgi:hypothetical protein
LLQRSISCGDDGDRQLPGEILTGTGVPVSGPG